MLEHNAIPYVLVEKEACCGMPKLELGDLEAVEKHKDVNIPMLARSRARATRSSRAIPSCTLMFKQELPLMFPDDADVRRSRKRCGTRSSTWSRAHATAC